MLWLEIGLLPQILANLHSFPKIITLEIKNLFVINGDTSNPIGVVRGIGRSFPNIRIHLLSTKKTFVNYSKYVDFNHFMPDWRLNPHKFATKVEDLFHQFSNNILIPTDDSSAFVFSRYKSKWEQNNNYVMVSDEETVNSLLYADLFRSKMGEENIPVVKAITIKSHKDLKNYLNLGVKVFVKPIDAKTTKKYLILRSITDYKKHDLDKMDLSQWIFQRWIDGFKIYMLYFYRDLSGNIACCAYDKIRQYPPYAGSGCFVITKKRPELINRSINLLNSMDYSGFAEFEYKYDNDTNVWYLLEINPRTTTQSRVSGGSSVDVEVFAIESVMKDYSNVRRIDFDEGMKWMLEIDDFLCLVRRRKDRTIGLREWFHSIRNVSNYGIWAKDDFGATFMNYCLWVSSKFIRLYEKQVKKVI